MISMCFSTPFPPKAGNGRFCAWYITRSVWVGCAQTVSVGSLRLMGRNLILWLEMVFFFLWKCSLDADQKEAVLWIKLIYRAEDRAERIRC